MREGRRDIVIVAGLWLAATIGLEWWAMSQSLHPIGASEESVIVDSAFDLLLILGIPVFTFVVVVLAYTMLRYRAGDSSDAGDSRRRERSIAWSWLAITSALAIFVTINPGLTGMAELAADDANEDLTIDVTADQWNWTFSYEDFDVVLEEADELVLPEGNRILLRVTSSDVIHSLWIPVFRIKADAVPGRVHEVYLTPTETGSFEADPNFRVQCAEMCGTGHARMRSDVRVVDQTEFDQWIAAQEGGGNG